MSSLVLSPWFSHLITIYLVCLNGKFTPKSLSLPKFITCSNEVLKKLCFQDVHFVIKAQ